MGSAASTAEVTLWQAQPGPQTALLSCPVEDIFFGGARGGGKSDGLLGDWMAHAHEYSASARGILFRRTYNELEEIERRANELYPAFGEFQSQKHTWKFRNGATLKLRYLDRDSDADSYQGHSYTWMGFDELVNWPSSAPVDKLRACLRSADGVPCCTRSTGNPGGPGHNWVKSRYIDPTPPYQPFFDEKLKTWRVYIPSLLDDNLALLQNDPDYWKRVEAAAAGREDLLKAWRYGQWDIVAGGAFDDLWNPSIHIIPWFEIPKGWRVDRSFDWGSTAPFSVGWWAESDGSEAPNGRTYPARTLFRIAELYGWNGKPNEGLRCTAAEIARKVKEIEAGFKFTVTPGPADTQIFDVSGGVCWAADMERNGVRWERADKGPGSRKTGFDRMRAMLKASLKPMMEEPGLFVFDTCRQFIRTIPVLPRDKKNPDDVDSASEDHVFDESRYRIQAIRRQVTQQKILGV